MPSPGSKRSWISLLLVAALFPIFGFGKLYEPGPPYNDPLGGTDAIYEYAQIAAIPIGLCIFWGMIGFFAFYRTRIGRLGIAGWTLTASGGLAIFLGALIYIPTRSHTFWTILLLGNFISAFGLLLIGITAIQKPFLTKWSWSPLVVGLLYTFIFLVGNLFPDYEGSLTAGIVIFILTSAGWALFGTTLKASASF